MIPPQSVIPASRVGADDGTRPNPWWNQRQGQHWSSGLLHPECRMSLSSQVSRAKATCMSSTILCPFEDGEGEAASDSPSGHSPPVLTIKVPVCSALNVLNETEAEPLPGDRPHHGCPTPATASPSTVSYDIRNVPMQHPPWPLVHDDCMRSQSHP